MVCLAAALCGCAGFRTPSIFHLGQKSPKERAAVGQRIDVLGGTESLAPAPALKGVSFSIPPPAPVNAWPVPGGTPEQSVEHVQAAPAFQVAWRRSIGAGSNRRNHVMAPPVAANGRIFVMDGRALVSAYDENGHEVWRTNLANIHGRDTEAFGGGLAFFEGTLYVSSGYRFVAALDSSTGKVKWRIDTPSPIHAAPNVAGGRVYVVDVADQLYVLDAATGQSDWTYQALEEPARMLAASSPAVSGDVVIAPFASGELIAFSTGNGNQLWQDVLSLTNRNNALSEIRDIAGRPVIYRGNVFAGSHAGVFASIDIRTGQRAWALPLSTITTPWPAGDVVYIVDQSGQLICAARDSGQIYWIQKLDDDLPQNAKRTKKAKREIHAVWSGPVLASGRLIVVSDRGEALALDPKTGQRKATLQLGSAGFLDPIAVDGRLYVLTNSAELIAIR